MTKLAPKPSSDASSGERKVMLALSLAFIGVNAVLFGASVPTASLIEADSLTYHTMAVQILETGSFQESTRQPLYPLLMAGTIALSHTSGLNLLIGLQLIFLYLTGFAAWRIARDWVPGVAATAVFGLVVLNPNAIGIAHAPLADTLHALLFTLAVWALLSWGTSDRNWQALACGVALGLATLTRPETKFLVYVLPVAIVLVALVAGRRGAWRIGVPVGFAALIVALAVTLPWMLHNQAVGHGLVISGGVKASENIRGQYALIEESHSGMNRHAVIKRLIAEEPTLMSTAGLDDASPMTKRKFLFRHYIGRIVGTDPGSLARLYAKAWIAQFASGGAQMLNRLLDIPISRPDKIGNLPDPVQALFESLPGQPLSGIVITVLGIGFAVAGRLLGLVGLVTICVRRHWPLFLVIASVLAFKAMIHLFYGNARYRLSAEPLLMIIAVYGWQGLRAALSSRR